MAYDIQMLMQNQGIGQRVLTGGNALTSSPFMTQQNGLVELSVYPVGSGGGRIEEYVVALAHLDEKTYSDQSKIIAQKSVRTSSPDDAIKQAMEMVKQYGASNVSVNGDSDLETLMFTTAEGLPSSFNPDYVALLTYLAESTGQQMTVRNHTDTAGVPYKSAHLPTGEEAIRLRYFAGVQKLELMVNKNVLETSGEAVKAFKRIFV